VPFVETAKFPAAVVTVTDLLNQKDKVPSQSVPTLSVAISSGGLSIVLVSGTGSRLPADNFKVSIENEIINIASRSSDTLTVAASGRGADGTVAAAHVAGSAVEARILAKHHNQLAAEVGAIETALGIRLRNVFGTKISSLATDTLIDETYGVILATGGAVGITLTLPLALGIGGRTFTFQRVDLDVGLVTLVVSGVDLIEDFSSYILVDQHQSVTLVSDNVSSWKIVSVSSGPLYAKLSTLGHDELLNFQVPGSNLIPNPGFERAQASVAIIPFWAKTGSGTTVVHVNSADAFTGNKCVEMSRTDAAETDLWSANDLGVSRIWEVVPGETYEFGAAGIQISGDALFWVGIVVFDKDGGAITAPAMNSSSATYVKLRGFQTMPANAKYISFRVIIAGGTVASTVRMDDAFLRRADVDLANFTVALLPASPVEGAVAFATNGRKFGEGPGAGTGVPVYFSNTQWRRFYDDLQVTS